MEVTSQLVINFCIGIWGKKSEDPTGKDKKDQKPPQQIPASEAPKALVNVSSIHNEDHG